jgi:pantetheine-phosphate adenylyltransferase
MRTGLFPGSFDPPTVGHMDIIARCALLFDHVVVGLLQNDEKKTMFTAPERLSMLRSLCEQWPNVSVALFSGLTVNLARDVGAQVIIRGIRSSDDLGYEQMMASVNKHLADEIETVILLTDSRYAHVSSSIVKSLAGYGGSIEGMVPGPVITQVHKKINEMEKGDHA